MQTLGYTVKWRESHSYQARKDRKEPAKTIPRGEYESIQAPIPLSKGFTSTWYLVPPEEHELRLTKDQRLIVPRTEMFGTDEKKHTEDPPFYSYSESKGSTSAVLSDTSHNVTLSVYTPSSGSYVPGSYLDAGLSIPPDVLSGIVGDVEIRLEGKSSVEIMGKPRYQVRPIY
jgi:hypothetical protein